ncbi:MAG: ATP phosphoribosyltransferase regulatory subunit [Oscillospiraceae bacterium]|nr:ATP phosphoribosyltransferase regulatory subunit [Oscillospiraceae bacterium]
MKMYAGCTPEGMRDLLFEECRVLRQAEKILERLLRSRGYYRVITPTIEFLDVFRNGGACRAENLYTLSDSQGRALVLRPDSTLPIARIAATRLRGAVLPLRLFYSQSVFRRNPRYAGEQDEIVQGGLELIGASGIAADLEVIITSIELLESCDANFRFEIGNAGFIAALCEFFKLSKDLQESIFAAIGDKDFAAMNDIVDTIDDDAARDALHTLPELFGDVQVLERAEKLVPTTAAREAIAYLRLIYNKLIEGGYGDKISLDLTPNSWGSYYTGIVFRGYLNGWSHIALTGGRYDALLEEYGESLSAIGMGVELSALAKALEPQKILVPDVLVFAPEGKEIEGLALVKKLNAEKKIAEFSMQSTLEEAREYAQRRGIETVIDVGAC